MKRRADSKMMNERKRKMQRLEKKGNPGGRRIHTHCTQSHYILILIHNKSPLTSYDFYCLLSLLLARLYI